MKFKEVPTPPTAKVLVRIKVHSFGTCQSCNMMNQQTNVMRLPRPETNKPQTLINHREIMYFMNDNEIILSIYLSIPKFGLKNWLTANGS